MYLLAGLGNPGPDYSLTRHNIGFIFIDYLIDKTGLSLRNSKWKASVAKTSLWGNPFLIIKPETYMNLSGLAVARAAQYYHIDVDKIIIVHDDLDLPLGKMRLVFNRGAGGHNGVRSVIEHIGGKNFIRIRVGIDRPQKDLPAAAYVLAKFSKEEKKIVAELLQNIEHALHLIVEENLSVAMNQINAGI